MMGLDKCNLLHLSSVALLLILEWWLPRQSRIPARSTIELVWTLLAALAATMVGCVVMIFLWRKNDDGN
jgi:hypothetical protein